MSRPAEFPVGTQGDRTQSVASVPRGSFPAAGPTPADFTPAAETTAAGVIFCREERA